MIFFFYNTIPDVKLNKIKILNKIVDKKKKNYLNESPPSS